MRLEGISAFVKEAKITKNGIVLSLEKVKLNGTSFDEFASLVQTEIFLDVESAQQTLELNTEASESEEQLSFDPDKTAAEALEEEGFEVVAK
jgi:hypothetical protein